jgi:beta-mannosidase
MSRRALSLNGANWQLGRAPAGADPGRADWLELGRVGEWLPATVPGNVRADLMRAGRLPDLVWGKNAEASRWVDDSCWWLVRGFSLNAGPRERVRLVLRGVDYVGDVFLNGHHLGRHEGMFSPQVHDVTGLLRTRNRLAVRIVGNRWLPHDRSSTWEKFLNHVEARGNGLADRFPHRRDTVKCQMGFGWDFAPPLPTLGIWDDVYAVVSGEVFLRDVATRQSETGSAVTLAAHLELDARQACSVTLRCVLTGETFDCDPVIVEKPVTLDPGSSSHTVEMAVAAPHLWWPWDHGRPDLYRLTTEVWDGDTRLDELGQPVGVRRVELQGRTLRLNGRRIYVRGSNWVPADVLPGRVTEDDYRALLTLARDANMNALRVWGGGLREKRAFYDLCDRMGILVWQEFPFACAFVTRFPRSPGYLGLVEDEARAIVRDMRNHPSLALWCGGNEFSPRRNAPLVAALRRAVTAEDPVRPFLPTSPGDGESHNWQVWHDFHPPTAYLRDKASFASEFGLQALPTAESLRRFVPAEDLWPPGPSWPYHGAGLQKLRRYARPFLDEAAPALEAFVDASQQAQAHGLQIAIEHYRRRKAAGCGGVLIWQLNEPWPAISWALVDFFHRPKPAYEAVKRVLRPILVSIEYRHQQFQQEEPFQARVWIINDRAVALPGCHLEVRLWSAGGLCAEIMTCTVDLVADSAEVVGSLDWTLPPGEGWRLTCRLSHDDELLATNEYDLGIHDDIRPDLRQRLWIWLRDRLLPA